MKHLFLAIVLFTTSAKSLTVKASVSHKGKLVTKMTSPDLKVRKNSILSHNFTTVVKSPLKWTSDTPIRKDMEILKQFGFNAVRTSHYPPVNKYLDPTRYWMYGGNAAKHAAEDIVGPHNREITIK